MPASNASNPISRVKFVHEVQFLLEQSAPRYLGAGNSLNDTYPIKPFINSDLAIVHFEA